MTQSKMAGFTVGFDGDNKVLEVSTLQALSPFLTKGYGVCPHNYMGLLFNANLVSYHFYMIVRITPVKPPGGESHLIVGHGDGESCLVETDEDRSSSR